MVSTTLSVCVIAQGPSAFSTLKALKYVCTNHRDQKVFFSI